MQSEGIVMRVATLELVLDQARWVIMGMLSKHCDCKNESELDKKEKEYFESFVKKIDETLGEIDVI